MSTEAEIVDRLQDAEDADGGIACPVCHGPTEVLHRRNPQGYIKRRRVCGRCRLRVTTTERIVGGYSPDELEDARRRWEQWKIRHGRTIPLSTDIEPKQRLLFRDDD